MHFRDGGGSENLGGGQVVMVEIGLTDVQKTGGRTPPASPPPPPGSAIPTFVIN